MVKLSNITFNFIGIQTFICHYRIPCTLTGIFFHSIFYIRNQSIKLAMNMRRFFYGLMVFACTGLLFSCQTGGSDEQDDGQLVDTSEMTMDISEEDDYSFIPPSPLQIASIFKHSGLQYVSDVANSTDRISNYSSSFKKQLNFGVYSADLSYCVLNNQSQDALKYMKAVRQLSDELGMSSMMNSEGLFESFNANVGNEDSMISILATVQEGMDDYLEDSEQQYLAAIFFAGGWIEGMHIGSKVAVAMDKELVKRLVEQMNILDGLVQGLEHHPNSNEDLTKLINDLKDIRSIYENFSAIKGMDTEADDFSFDEVNISEDELAALKQKIEATRTWIVE